MTEASHQQQGNPAEWRRVGRGKSFEVDLGAQDLTEVLLNERALHHSDWLLISCRKVLTADQYTQESRVLTIQQLPEFVAQGWWQFFLWSPSIDTQLTDRTAGGLSESLLSLLGLINIQCGRRSRLGLSKTALGLVDRVQNVQTNELVHNTKYADVFKRLSRALKVASKALS